MSGHNKWSKIKHKKAATDAQKSKIFGKYAKLISVESKKSGGDTSSPGLRAAIEKAKSMNMPSDNIDRAVKKGAGGDSGNMEEVLYEAYGPGGCGIIIEGLTDNKNRTGAEVRHIFTKQGLSLATPGAASWNFEKREGGFEPKTTVKLTEEDEKKLEAIIELLEDNDDIQDVYSSAE